MIGYELLQRGYAVTILDWLYFATMACATFATASSWLWAIWHHDAVGQVVAFSNGMNLDKGKG